MNSNYQIAVVEDQREYKSLVLDYLNTYIRDQYISVDIFTFENGQEILDAKDTKFDLIFLTLICLC